MRIGDAGDSGSPHVRDGIELAEMLQKVSNKLRFQAFYINDDEPLQLRAVQGHSVIEAKPKLLEWREITASEAPR